MCSPQPCHSRLGAGESKSSRMTEAKADSGRGLGRLKILPACQGGEEGSQNWEQPEREGGPRREPGLDNAPTLSLHLGFLNCRQGSWLQGMGDTGQGCLQWLVCMYVTVAQLCPTLCHPMDYRVHGILQARILEWVAFPFSRGSSQPRDQTQVSHIAGGFFTS